MAENSIVTSVRSLVEPIASDLGVEVYDLDFNRGQLTVTLDTPPGSEGGITLDTLALATRLISRELDHVDPIPGHYTLEVSSPGLERVLRTPAHFQREIGKTVTVRLRNVVEGDRRLSGVLVAADDTTCTVRLDDAALTERVVPYDQIDRARTVFVWGPAPKPGKGPKPASPKRVAPAASGAARGSAAHPDSARSDDSSPSSTTTEAP